MIFEYLIPGLILLLIGTGFLIEDHLHSKNCIETDGIVYGYKMYTDEGKDYYRASIRYKVEAQYYKGVVGSYSKPPEVGDRIPVRYDPNNPLKVEKVTEYSIALKLFPSLLGIAIIAFGIISALLSWKKLKKQQPANSVPDQNK